MDIVGSQQNPIPSARLPEVKDSPDFHSAASFAVRYVGFNNKLAPFDNADVRRAFALAVDKATLANAVLNGAVAPTDRILPPGFTGSQLPIKGLAFDSAAAKQALTDAGYGESNPFPQVTFTYGVEGDNERVATFLQQQWKENLGVDVVLEPLELATFSKNLDTTYLTPEEGLQFYLSIWGADYPDPQNFVSQQLRSDSPNNNGHWENAQFDELAKQADTFLGSAEERLQLYNQAEQIAVDEVGWLPLYVPQFSVLIRPEVAGYSLTGQGLIFPDWTKVRADASQARIGGAVCQGRRRRCPFPRLSPCPYTNSNGDDRQPHGWIDRAQAYQPRLCYFQYYIPDLYCRLPGARRPDPGADGAAP